MTPTLISLICLILAFAALVLWVWNPKSSTRWEEAQRLPFEANDANDPENAKESTHD